ncbi:aerobic carbon-monoxide dehydrogenase large subunit [Sinimarinibacterium flocculans]|uniref:Carbon monoxide dehydrogenase large chain n=1 Tax=Sinimarinibacterium flocculans TaxID=985250 RepID=A0A318E658_9GAMM|nr:aerobic carbon-monoxide dehydrogenase large subunit [Sinimarinibacterium flocculans]PXV65705.1 carbon monoxide dehydrogenase large subunit apoprotein [Sinimarinibacterium flocculans]
MGILEDQQARIDQLGGIGCGRKRKEDARFIQGKGNYVDDVKLPGMLHADFVRSPYGHARIKSIDTSKALALPGVRAVLTAKDLAPLKLHWMPTLAGDVQAVLADEKVGFQYQEVAFVVADDRYIAADAVDLVKVEYEELPSITDPFHSMDPDAPVIRPDLDGKDTGAHGKRKHYNHIFTWEVGDKAETDRVFETAPVTVKEQIWYPRNHGMPLETCGSVASFDKVNGELKVWVTSQAPHVVRTVVSLLSGLDESKVHVVAPDIGGGFGVKVGVYPGYVCSIVASIVLGKPVKWIEDRVEHLAATAFGRDYHMTGELAADADGRIQAARFYVLADHGAFDSCADPTKWPAGFFNICTGSYDIKAAHVTVDGVYTNKTPGGVSYRCSFRVTEGSYVIERMIDVLAQKMGLDKAEIRLRNFIKPEQFPYQSALGWEYDSGSYEAGLRKVMEVCDYAALRREQEEKRKRGELMGIGLSTFTEIVGAGPTKICDILGVGMFDSCEIRIHPTGSAIARFGTKDQGQSHRTTYAQILATEVGIPSESIMIEEGDTDTAPYGLGTYGSRSTPTAGAAAARAGRKIRAKAQKIAAHLLEVAEDDLEWDIDRFVVKGVPDQAKTMKEIAWAAYNRTPPGLEPGLEAVEYYDPPNMTYPSGAYLCVVDIDRHTGEVKVRRFYALDDCGTRINPMVIDGQIHGGLTEAFAVAMGQELPYDKAGNLLGASLLDYFVPTAVETPRYETDFTVTPSPHHPIGAKGVGESPHVGGVSAFSNAVIDAFAHAGVTHLNMPYKSSTVWKTIHTLNLDQRA